MIVEYLWKLYSDTERPEEAYDHRTLYERLKEQKDRKQEEFMEQLKFSKYESWYMSDEIISDSGQPT